MTARGRSSGPSRTIRGPRRCARRRRVAARRRARAGRGALHALRGRVRPARAVRHARAVGRALRPGVGRGAADLAALRRRCGGGGPAERARGPADPGQLRGEAEHDRPLGRRGVRRARRARTVGEHGGGGVHGPWALSRREGHLGEARSHAVRAAGAHPAAGALAGRRRRDDVRRVDDERRHQRHAGRRVRCAARRGGGGRARHIAGTPAARRGGRRCGSGPSAVSTGIGSR